MERALVSSDPTRRVRTRHDPRSGRAPWLAQIALEALSALSHRPIKRGIEAGLIASVPQVLLSKAEEWLLMPPGEDADLGPHFIERLASIQRLPLREDTKWLAASAFHFGYAVFWGALYAVAYRRWRPQPLMGGLALGGLIYAITFPHWGGAVMTGAERPPHRRSWRKELMLATAALSFGVGTALLYGRQPSSPDEPRDGAA